MIPKIMHYEMLFGQEEDDTLVINELQNTTGTPINWGQTGTGKYQSSTLPDEATATNTLTISGMQDGDQQAMIPIMASGAAPLGYYSVEYNSGKLEINVYDTTGTAIDLNDLTNGPSTFPVIVEIHTTKP